MELAAAPSSSARTSPDPQTSLQAASGGGHLEVVERLLYAGADVDATAFDVDVLTPLQMASSGGYLRVVDCLLAARADVNATAADLKGRTALQGASHGGHPEVVEGLLSAGADVNAPAAVIEGLTALQAASSGGHLKVVEPLLNAGADANAAASKYDGRTALQAASDGGYLVIVHRLVDAGAHIPAAGRILSFLRLPEAVSHEDDNDNDHDDAAEALLAWVVDALVNIQREIPLLPLHRRAVTAWTSTCPFDATTGRVPAAAKLDGLRRFEALFDGLLQSCTDGEQPLPWLEGRKWCFTRRSGATWLRGRGQPRRWTAPKTAWRMKDGGAVRRAFYRQLDQRRVCGVCGEVGRGD